MYHVGGADPQQHNVYDVNTSPGLREFSSLVRTTGLRIFKRMDGWETACRPQLWLAGNKQRTRSVPAVMPSVTIDLFVCLASDFLFFLELSTVGVSYGGCFALGMRAFHKGERAVAFPIGNGSLPRAVLRRRARLLRPVRTREEQADEHH